jgi:hypothetical protein
VLCDDPAKSRFAKHEENSYSGETILRSKVISEPNWIHFDERITLVIKTPTLSQ